MLFAVQLSVAQDAPRLSSKNEKALSFFSQAFRGYNANNLDAAITNLEKAIAEDSLFTEAYQLKADISHLTANYKAEESAYQKLIDHNLTSDPRTYYYLGMSQYRQGNYRTARFSVQKALLNGSLQAKVRESAKRDLLSIDYSLYAVAHPYPYILTPLGDSINSRFNDYWPSVTADESMMIITSEMPSVFRDVSGNFKGQEDMFSANSATGKWLKMKNIGTPINTIENEGSQSISFNGQFLFFTACNRPDSKGRCDIYMAERLNDKWQPAFNIGEPVNSAAWESQPCLSPDGRTLYFSSSRPGGKGGKDIWQSEINEHGFWSNPVNLGDSINTPGDENSPFIHYDNRTLYFSSDGYPGLGGQDLLVAHKIRGAWHRPENLGYPINSHKDEIGLVINTAGDKAWFSTERDAARGKDIYQFTLPERFRPKPVSFVRGTIVDADTKKEIKADFELSDLQSEELVTKTSSISGSGDYVVCLPSDQDLGLNVSKKGYIFHSQNFKIDKNKADANVDLDINLQTIKVGRTEVLRNVFYDTDVFSLDKRSITELKYLVRFLNENKTVSVEIGGHTDNVGSEEHNATLSENRAKLVYMFLIDNKIDPKRLSYKGYSFSVPVADNATPEGRASNRRTEFKITAVK